MKIVNLTNIGLFAVTMLTSCSEPPAIDATTEDSLKQSLKEVRGSLKGTELAEFEEAMDLIEEVAYDNFEGIMPRDGQGEPDFFAVVNGKTPDEVVLEAQDLRAKMVEKILELDASFTAGEEATEKLKAIEVQSSVFERRFPSRNFEELGEKLDDGGESLKKPVIEISIKNGLPEPVSAAHFRCKLSSPNRSVSWGEVDFTFEIPGGIEPNEDTTITMTPDWNHIKPTADAVLDVSVYRVDGSDGRPILDTKGHFRDAESEDDLKWLIERKEFYGVEIGADATK